MSLKKWINFKYLYQNFKKSKSLFIFLICIVPFINFWIIGINLLSKNYIIDFYELGKVSIIIAFLLPIIVAFLLFGFVFKKSAIDFIMSKPISRKQIFISNILGGITYLLLIVLINFLGFIILSLITNLFIPFGAIIDYLIYFSITYIFIFIISVLAIALSGNIVGFIIIILLLLFLYPTISYIEYKINSDFSNIYYVCEDASCMPDKNYCNNDAECLKMLNENNYKYEVSLKYEKINTTPINYFNSGFSTKSIIKTVILSIIYVVIAYYIFKNRKMENSEISFKNKYLYKIIKILSYIPITYLAYMFYSADKSFIIIAIVICIVYYYLYDIIVNKHINKVFKTGIEMIIVSIIFLGSYFIYENICKNNDKLLSIPNEVTINYTDNVGVNYDILLSDKSLINELIIPTKLDDYNSTITIIFDDLYYLTRNINANILEKIDNYAKNNNLKDKFTAKNILHITSSLDSELTFSNDTNFKNEITSYIDNYNSNNIKYDIYITLYKYENHILKELMLNVSGDKYLLNYVKNIYNEEFLKRVENAYVTDEEISEDFSNVFIQNKDDFISFLQKHQHDELTNDIIILYSDLDRYYINRDIFLMEYDKYVTN